ncbi:ABC transporter permease [Martelella sp. HB161492]|uniref:ABC transporter permease n=1 Tax=Martelella sp. HB161492 TaxID=2720726 RepID=UPI0015905AEC|nr:ABC transporter permease [Martelella sp. HB161492]
MTKAKTTIFLLPGIALTLAVFILPFAFLTVTSFWSQKEGSLLLDPSFTLKNYIRILTDRFFLSVVWRTLLIGLATVAICLAFGLPIARWISHRARKARGLLIILILTPMISGALVQTLGLVNLLSLLGLVNGALKSLGLIHSSIHFLGNETGVLIGLVQAFLPLMVLPLVTTLSRLPRDMELAAHSLGANGFQIWRTVILPLAMPGILAGCVLVFFAAVTSFVTPQILGQGKTPTFGTVMYQQVAMVNDWPFASALAVVMLIILALVTFALKRWSGAQK